MEIGLSLGSNCGDRLRFLQSARDALCRADDVRLIAQSPVYETDPVGVREQYADRLFLNAILVLDADQPASQLAPSMHVIETRLGRVRTDDPNAPRTIDIDMLYAIGSHSAPPDLILPHPRCTLRRFVLQPLAEVRPDLVLPGQQLTVKALLSTLPPRPAARLFATDW